MLEFLTALWSDVILLSHFSLSIGYIMTLFGVSAPGEYTYTCRYKMVDKVERGRVTIEVTVLTA